MSEIKKLNSIISDNRLFKIEWEKYIESQKISYKSLLFDQNKYIRALKSKGMLPGIFFHSKEHQTLLLNLLKCETHREIMINVIDEKIP